MRRCLYLFLPVLACGAVVRSVSVKGLERLSASAVIDVAALQAGDGADSIHLAQAVQRLMFTGHFDTAACLTGPGSDSVDIKILVREKPAGAVYPDGGSLNSSMYGEDKLWITASAGASARHLFRHMQTFSLSVAAPYAYEAGGHWRGFGLPVPGARTGVSFSLRSSPSAASPYFSQQVSTSVYVEKLLAPAVVGRLFGGEDVTRTWLIDIAQWSRLDYVLWTDPPEISLATGLFPRNERSPYIGASVKIDRRNAPYDPRRGTFFFLEGRRVWIDNLSHSQSIGFYQFSAAAQGYLALSPLQTAALQIKAVTRNRFDEALFGHRLQFYNNDTQFRGFRYSGDPGDFAALSGVSLAFANLEYRFRALEVRYADLGIDLKVDERVQKMLQRLDYAVDLFGFVDNGAFFGGDRKFSSLDPARDLFSSIGSGLRLVYPRLNQGGSAGVVFYHRKPGLTGDARLYFYLALSLGF